MGRVDEAMRRAGVRSDTETPDAGAAVGSAVDEFPIETAASDPDILRKPEPSSEAPAEPTERQWFGDVRAAAAPLAAKLVVDDRMSPGSREQYRRLAAVLHHAQVATGVKVVMIGSAMVGEGKTLTASNLSLTLSESFERRVLLVDADLRRPSLHKIFKVDPVPGLSDSLMCSEPGRLPVHRVSERLTLLPAGRPTSNPMAGLTSQHMRDLLAEARDTFDFVIIDTPPIALMPDANLLAAMADGALLVVKAGTTPYPLAERAIDAIGRDRLLGAVLNRVTDFGVHGSSYYSSNYYRTYYGRSTESSASGR
jgi:capsular exopolysaccharide synthesis family protein